MHGLTQQIVQVRTPFHCTKVQHFPFPLTSRQVPLTKIPVPKVLFSYFSTLGWGFKCFLYQLVMQIAGLGRAPD